MKLGTHVKTGEQFAVKIMNKEKDNPRKKEIIDIEIEILKRVNHPHVSLSFFLIFLFQESSLSFF